MELDSCLRTPATCEFVSHRTMNNVVSGSQYGSKKAGGGWSLELVATVRGLRLTVEPFFASERLSEISSNYSNLAVVCTRQVSKLGAILGADADPKITVVGQMWCGKWILKMFPSLVGFSCQVASYFGAQGREQAKAMLTMQRAAWPENAGAGTDGRAKEARSVSFAPAEESEGQAPVQSLSTVVPLQGVLKRVTLPHKQHNQRSADLNRQYLASLASHDPLPWRSGHKRTRSLNSLAMIESVVQGFEMPSSSLPKDADAGNGDAVEFGQLLSMSSTPISIHLQASMDAAVNATVPAEGQMKFRIKGCTVSLTQTTFEKHERVSPDRGFRARACLGSAWSASGDESNQTMQTLSFSIDRLAAQVAVGGGMLHASWASLTMMR
eukprot:586385-Rhodomonas_salina.3